VNLSLATCHITDEGALVIGRALDSNVTIKTISLRDNFLSEQAGFSMVEVLKTNESLWAVDLTSTQIDYFGLEAIDAIVKRNCQKDRNPLQSDLRKKIVKLRIQKAKIPTISTQLRELNEQTGALSSAINSLNGKTTAVDNDTAGVLLLADKTATERKEIASLHEKTANIEVERKSVISELTEKTAKCHGHQLQKDRRRQHDFPVFETGLCPEWRRLSFPQLLSDDKIFQSSRSLL
jgi:outer membrane murein-binding lipoprotein Lpp